MNGLLPDTYAIHRADREDGRRGGGVVLIFKQCLNVKRKEKVSYSQFECIICSLVINKLSLCIIVVYRPPPSPENHLNTNTFLTEWAEFLSHYVTDTVELIVVGDINLHLDAHSHCHTKAMMQTLESCGLQQHIRDPTHYCGHILDVLISRDSSTLLPACEVRDIGLSDNNGNTMNGHYAITCEIKQRMSSTKSKSVSYRKLKAIDITQFRNSLQASLTLSNLG